MGNKNIGNLGAATRFKPGVQIWKLRSKHGREKLFTSPKAMLDAAMEYFDICEANPVIIVEYHGSKKVKVPKMRVPTWQGLCAYLKCSAAYFRTFKHNLTSIDAAKQTQADKDFLDIIEQIDDLIYNNKFTGAAAGVYTPMLIMRDLKLSDRTEATNSNLNYNVPVSKEEAIEIAKQLEEEY